MNKFKNVFLSLKTRAVAFMKDLPSFFDNYFHSNSFKKLVKEAIRLAAIIAGCFLFSLILILLSSKKPGISLQAFFAGPFKDKDSWAQIIDESLPLIFTGAAVCLMNRAGQCNMFVEGAFFLGAFLAAYLAPLINASSFIIHLTAILVGGCASALVGYIPAKMKASLGINEFVSSLMFNYIVFWIVMYLLSGPCSDPDVADKTKYLEDNMKLAVWDSDTGLSSAILLALIVSLLCFFFLFKTTWGYRLRMTGDNKEFAEYSGINTKHSIVASQVLGAFIAGIGGAIYVLGSSRLYRFEWKALPNYGFDGFVIAIMAGNNPLTVPLASFFLAYLRVGASKMTVLSDVPNQIVYIIQAVIIILFSAQFVFKFFKKKNKATILPLKEGGK